MREQKSRSCRLGWDHEFIVVPFTVRHQCECRRICRTRGQATGQCSTVRTVAFRPNRDTEVLFSNYFHAWNLNPSSGNRAVVFDSFGCDYEVTFAHLMRYTGNPNIDHRRNATPATATKIACAEQHGSLHDAYEDCGKETSAAIRRTSRSGSRPGSLRGRCRRSPARQLLQ